MLTKEMKRAYLFFVVAGFTLGLIAVMMFFRGSAGEIAGGYILTLLFYVFLLSFIYGLVKFFFHLNARSEKDELKLEEIPKDQEDIRRTH